MDLFKAVLAWLLSLFPTKDGPELVPKPVEGIPDPPTPGEPVEDPETGPTVDTLPALEPTAPVPEEPTVPTYDYEPKEVWSPIEQNYTNSSGSPRQRWYSEWTRTPWVIIVHYSAGYSAQGCQDALTNRGLSVHCSIERDGLIWRHIKNENRGIHAGYGKWGGVSGMNSHAFGFEIINLGWVEGEYDPAVKSPHFVFDPATAKEESGHEVNTDPDGRVWWRDESYQGSDGKMKWTRVLSRQTSSKFPDHRADQKDRLWAEYPDVQLDAVFWQIWDWMKTHDILPENVIGHEHVTPHKKTDPGPSFPWRKLEAFIEERCRADKPDLIDPALRLKERVKAVQSHCARMGLPVGDIDGYWGANTENAIEEAISDWGKLYGFSDLRVGQDNCYAIANALRLVPGFDPDRG